MEVEVKKEWYDEIKDRFEESRTRKVEIHTALFSLLQTLNTKVGLRANIEMIDELNLIWAVTIGSKTVEITQDDVRSYQLSYPDDSGRSEPLEERNDLTQSLTRLILDKFHWTVLK
jgi:hypothetical protein